MRSWKSTLSGSLLLLLAACRGETPDRARIIEARLLHEGGAAVLEVTQDLRFSRTMRDALDHGIPLRLRYLIEDCQGMHSQVLQMSYSPLNRHYELQLEGVGAARRFARRGAMLASIDRVRLPLTTEPPQDCDARISVALDLTSLPTPLRFPALFQPDQWRLVSPAVPFSAPASWNARSPRA
jgi:hypothetical protein